MTDTRNEWKQALRAAKEPFIVQLQACQTDDEREALKIEWMAVEKQLRYWEHPAGSHPPKVG